MQLRRTPNNWRKLHTAWRTATAGLLCPRLLAESPLRRTTADSGSWHLPLFVRRSFVAGWHFPWQTRFADHERLTAARSVGISPLESAKRQPAV